MIHIFKINKSPRAHRGTLTELNIRNKVFQQLYAKQVVKVDYSQNWYFMQETTRIFLN